MRRRKTAIFFLVLGISLSALAIALNVGWILLNLREVVLLVLGIVFFLVLIFGLVLNTTFLIREIRRNEQHDKSGMVKSHGSVSLRFVSFSFQSGAAQPRDGYCVQETPAGAPVGAPIRTAGDASF